MKGKTLNFGVLGYGKHVEKHILRAFDLSEKCVLRSVATRDANKAGRLSAASGLANVYNSYEQLIAEKTLDVIYISLPNDMHAEWSIRALDAGKHVVCEKPLAMNAGQAREIKSAAARNGRQFFEAFMYRFHPRHRRVKQLLEDGAIGELRYFEAHYQYFTDDYSNIRLQKERGGGGLMDVGSYTVDASRYFLNQMPSALCATWRLDERSGVDITANAQLFYTGGLTALLSCGGMLPRANNYSICGTKGIIRTYDSFNIPPNKPSFIEVQAMDVGDVERIRIEAANHFQIMLDAFASRLDGDEKYADCFGDGEDNLRVIDAIRFAAESNQRVSLT